MTSTRSSWSPSELFSVLRASIVACFCIRVSVREWSRFSSSSWLDAFNVFVVSWNTQSQHYDDIYVAIQCTEYVVGKDLCKRVKSVLQLFLTWCIQCLCCQLRHTVLTTLWNVCSHPLAHGVWWAKEYIKQHNLFASTSWLHALKVFDIKHNTQAHQDCKNPGSAVFLWWLYWQSK